MSNLGGRRAGAGRKPEGKGGQVVAVWLYPEHMRVLDDWAHAYTSGNRTEAIRQIIDSVRRTRRGVAARSRET